MLLRAAPHAGLPERRYAFSQHVAIGGADCLVSRTGYTGEDGFELYLAPDDAMGVWRLLLEYGKELGVVSCGLGARDTLRLEAAMPLYGHELNDDITPVEAGLGRFVKSDKPDFIGKAALQTASSRSLVGLKVTGRGIVREHMTLFSGNRKSVFRPRAPTVPTWAHRLP